MTVQWMVCELKDEIDVIPENVLKTTVIKCHFFLIHLEAIPLLYKMEVFYTLF